MLERIALENRITDISGLVTAVDDLRLSLVAVRGLNELLADFVYNVFESGVDTPADELESRMMALNVLEAFTAAVVAGAVHMVTLRFNALTGGPTFFNMQTGEWEAAAPETATE